MRARSFDELVESDLSYGEALRNSPDVDAFCSGHAFSVAAFSGLLPGRESRVYEVDGAGWLVFARRHASLFGDPEPRELWEPYEAMWGLGCPIVGGDVARLGHALGEVLHTEAPTATLLCCGLRTGSMRSAAVAVALSPTHRLLLGSPTVRQVASLDGGVDGFLARRSARFRANLRRALRDASRRGLVHERHVPDPAQARALYVRAVAVDDRSWKGGEKAGLRGTGLHDFYADMLPRLAGDGSLRMHFLVEPTPRGPVDVGYLFGGVAPGSTLAPGHTGTTFRGLQFAFVEGKEHLSLGNIAQYYAIDALCEEGVQRYDLGTQVDYKRHWGELTDETMSLIAIPRGTRGPRP